MSLSPKRFPDDGPLSRRMIAAEIITGSDEADRYRRTRPGSAHGSHDTLVRIRPQTVTGFRLAHAEAVR